MLSLGCHGVTVTVARHSLTTVWICLGLIESDLYFAQFPWFAPQEPWGDTSGPPRRPGRLVQSGLKYIALWLGLVHPTRVA